MAASSSSSCPHVALLMPLATIKGGAEQTLRHLLEERDRTGLDWTVIFFEDGPLAAYCRDQPLDTVVVDPGRLRQPVSFFRCVRRLATLFRERQVDVVCSWMTKAHFYGGLAALWSGHPAIWFQHAFPADVHWMDRLATLIPAEGVLACSHAGAALQKTLWPTRPTEVVHPGVDLDHFDPDRLPPSAELRERFGLPPDAPIVGTVGRLQHWKGMHVFIDAVARLRTDYPDLKGLIVGGPHDLEPNYPAQLRQQIARRDLEDCIVTTGFQPDPAAWMSTFDVFVHAADREPFGLVVLEAMALGRPVVASDTAGPTEMITAEETGLFAPFGDATTLARQIRRYLDAPDWAATIGRAARSRAQDFSTARFAEKVGTAIRSLVALPPASASP